MAIYSDGQNQMLTNQLLPAFADGATPQTWALTRQVDDYVMQNAMDAPIAFAPAVHGLFEDPGAGCGACADRHLQPAGPDWHHLRVGLSG